MSKELSLLNRKSVKMYVHQELGKRISKEALKIAEQRLKLVLRSAGRCANGKSTIREQDFIAKLTIQI